MRMNNASLKIETRHGAQNLFEDIKSACASVMRDWIRR